MIPTDTNMKNTARIAHDRIVALSASGKASELQEEYLKVIEGLLIEKSLDSPFSQDEAGIAAFFKESSARWEKRKAELDA